MQIYILFIINYLVIYFQIIVGKEIFKLSYILDIFILNINNVLESILLIVTL